MSIAAISYVWQHSKQEGGALLVMLALADYADDQGYSFPAVSTLARKARLSERQTQRVLKLLVEAGEIKVLPNEGRAGSNLYQILRQPPMPAMPAMPASPTLRKCELCTFESNDPIKLNIHHKQPTAFGGRDVKANRITLCVTCHGLMHAEPGKAELTEAGVILRDLGLPGLHARGDILTGVTLRPLRGDICDNKGVTPTPPDPSSDPSRDPSAHFCGGAELFADYAGQLPPPLNSPTILAAWEAFKAHRKEKRIPLTPTATKMAIAKLLAMGPARALAALTHSTTAGYTGIFEPKPNHEKSNTHGGPTSRNNGTFNHGREWMYSREAREAKARAKAEGAGGTPAN